MEFQQKLLLKDFTAAAAAAATATTAAATTTNTTTVGCSGVGVGNKAAMMADERESNPFPLEKRRSEC